MKLYLIRHAESEANVHNLLDTVLPGPPLTERGRQQAQALADKLRDEPVVAVYASYATRAQQTARPLADALAMEVQAIEGVHEVGVGALEGLGDEESIRTYLRVVRSWAQGDLDLGMPGGGETGEQVRSRYLAAVAELRAKHEKDDADGVVALVSHGGSIRLGAEWLADNVRPELVGRDLIPNTGIIVLESLPAGGWTCLSWVGRRP